MNELKKICVIPALNEEKTIRQVVREVRKYVDAVIVIDDASTDNTARLALAEGAVVVSHQKNLGYDRSINDGFAAAVEHQAGIILTFDADRQHNSGDIPGMVDPINEGKADIVVGKRPSCARLMERLFVLIAKRKVGIEDPLCGLKAYRATVYKDIGYFDCISSIGTQLMFDAHKKGYRILQKEISLNPRVDDSRFGKKLKANWKIGIAIVKTLVRG